MSNSHNRMSDSEVNIATQIHHLSEQLNAKILEAKLSGIDVILNTTVFNDGEANSFVGITYRMTAELCRSSFSKLKPSHWTDAIKDLHKNGCSVISPD